MAGEDTQTVCSVKYAGTAIMPSIAATSQELRRGDGGRDDDELGRRGMGATLWLSDNVRWYAQSERSAIARAPVLLNSPELKLRRSCQGRLSPALREPRNPGRRLRRCRPASYDRARFRRS